MIDFQVCDFAETEIRDLEVIMFNPEYGERLGEE
jgi:23S rRNA G2445 N2-methylase RlmL